MAVAELTDKEKKVLNYIKDYESKGYSDDKIKVSLNKSGIDDITIDKCLKIARNKPLYKKPVFWIGAGFVVLLVFLLLVYVIPQLLSNYYISSELECSTSVDCASGYDCVSNKCVIVEDDEILPDVECLSDSDCDSGENCQLNVCVSSSNVECLSDSECDTGENCQLGVCVEHKGAEPQCGDGNCDIGEESCALDCGCISNSQCLTYGQNYYCNSVGACAVSSGSSSGGSSGGSSGTTTSCTTGDLACTCNAGSTCTSPYVCDTTRSTCVVCTADSQCSSGYACDETAGTCYDIADCEDGVDNDGDGEVDLTGGCDSNSDRVIDYVCGCYNSTNGFSSYSGSDNKDCSFYSGTDYDCMKLSDSSLTGGLTCGLGKDIEGIYYNADEYCTSEDPEFESECTLESDCESGYTCVDETCVEEPAVVAGAEVCTDTIDNDGDSLVDCLDSDCATYSACTTTIDTEICDNYKDDDGDNLVDLTGGCDTDSDLSIEYVCGCYDSANEFSSYSGSDNTDCSFYSGTDYECMKLSDSSLSGRETCGIGEDIEGIYYNADSSCIEYSIAVEDCLNGIDDDADGLIDFADTDECSLIDYINSCSDSDSGSYLVQGIVSYVLTNGTVRDYATDYCKNSTSLWEYSCNLFEEKYGPGGSLVNCSSLYTDSTCVYGACVITGSMTGCVDEDEEDFYRSGWAVNPTGVYSDYCSNEADVLYEALCVGDNIEYKSFGCNCLSGACVVAAPSGYDTITEICTDSVDNDGNSLVDCDDPDCVNDLSCVTGLVCSEVLPECADGVDNDQDGLIDMTDSDCRVFGDDDESDCVRDNGCSNGEICVYGTCIEEVVVPLCNDFIDNDDDSLIDYYGTCEVLGVSHSCDEFVEEKTLDTLEGISNLNSGCNDNTECGSLEVCNQESCVVGAVALSAATGTGSDAPEAAGDCVTGSDYYSIEDYCYNNDFLFENACDIAGYRIFSCSDSGCSESSCSSSVAVSLSDDDGDNPFVKGTVLESSPASAITDQCIDRGNLLEITDDGNVKIYSCIFGCHSGMCKTGSYQCNDGLDNDRDGMIDLLDSDCLYEVGNSESVLSVYDISAYCEDYCNIIVGSVYTERDSGCSSEVDITERNFDIIEDEMIYSEMADQYFIDHGVYPIVIDMAQYWEIIDQLENEQFDIGGSVIDEANGLRIAINDGSINTITEAVSFVQENNYNANVAEELANAGIPLHQIVLGLESESTDELESESTDEIIVGLQNAGYNANGIGLGLALLGGYSEGNMVSLGYSDVEANACSMGLLNADIIDTVGSLMDVNNIEGASYAPEEEESIWSKILNFVIRRD